MSIPNSRKANNIPGDTLRVTTERATDSEGREWPRGTKFQPLAGGYDNSRGCKYAEVSTSVGRVVFLDR